MEGLALSYSREKPGSDKRVELLSCVAQQYTNKELKQMFKFTNSRGEEVSCTDYEITKARLHSKTHGPGAALPKIRRQYSHKLRPETIAFVLEFIHHPDSVEYSSYKTAPCDGKHKSWISELLGGGNQPVLWLKQNKSALYDRYKQECGQLDIQPISFSTFFKGLSAGNFKIMAEKAGLCNICTELGAENFMRLDKLLTRLSEMLRSQGKPDLTPELMSKAKKLKGYLLSEFQSNLKIHSDCATHCASLWLSDNPPCGNLAQHQETCQSCLQIFHTIKEIKCANYSNDPQIEQEVAQIEENLNNYIGHIVRGKYQREQFLNDINNLSPGQAVMVADYMMKLLFQKLFEPQKDWFAKKGVSLHGSMFLFKKEENGEVFTEFHDLYSESDDKQNWYFSASCLEESIKNFKKLHPEMSTITLWTDNGAHYKNTSLLLWLSNISALTGVQVTSFRNFEPQKGKTKLDGHYATLKFSLKRFRREGNDVMSGEQIEKGTNGRLRGTRVYGVSIDRSKEPESAKTMKGITEFSDFEYFYDENKNLQYIIARNQTRMIENKRYDASDLKKLMEHCFEKESTGSKSNFCLEYATTVKELSQRPNISTVKKDNLGTPSYSTALTTLPGNNSCCNCGKSFLRKGNLMRHKEIGSCFKSPSACDEDPIKNTVSLIKQKACKQTRTEGSDLSTEEKSWLNSMPGRADKSNRPTRTNKHFSEQQKKIMIECYLKGVEDRNKRYTAAMCQDEMLQKLGVGNQLKENQIKSFWSRYHRQRNYFTNAT